MHRSATATHDRAASACLPPPKWQKNKCFMCNAFARGAVRLCILCQGRLLCEAPSNHPSECWWYQNSLLPVGSAGHVWSPLHRPTGPTVAATVGPCSPTCSWNC